MGRWWTGYASMGGSTRPISLSRGEGVWCISSHATITYHCWRWLCVRKMPLGKYVARPPRGAECEILVYIDHNTVIGEIGIVVPCIGKIGGIGTALQSHCPLPLCPPVVRDRAAWPETVVGEKPQ